jgi:hypothetical protein
MSTQRSVTKNKIFLKFDFVNFKQSNHRKYFSINFVNNTSQKSCVAKTFFCSNKKH